MCEIRTQNLKKKLQKNEFKNKNIFMLKNIFTFLIAQNIRQTLNHIYIRTYTLTHKIYTFEKRQKREKEIKNTQVKS